MDCDGNCLVDTDEDACLTDTLDEEDMPIDTDGDGICDGADPNDDSEIFFSYPFMQQKMTVLVWWLDVSFHLLVTMMRMQITSMLAYVSLCASHWLYG